MPARSLVVRPGRNHDGPVKSAGGRLGWQVTANLRIQAGTGYAEEGPSAHVHYPGLQASPAVIETAAAGTVSSHPGAFPGTKSGVRGAYDWPERCTGVSTATR